MIVYLLGEPMPVAEVRALTGAREPVCVLHRYHAPQPLRLVAHHVWPLGHGGPAGKKAELALMCDNGHAAIHEILKVMLAGMLLPPHFGARTERRMARRGYELIQAGRM